MREILFRGKRVDNGELCFGSVDKYYRKRTKTVHWFILGENDGEEWEVAPETVGQFTGLTDKNGKKIFEGDIVKNSFGKTGCVGFYEFRSEDLTPEYKTITVSLKSGNYLYWITDGSEVIGNIHDNPELLEEQDNG